jgi:hypothetical protein
MWAKRLDEIKKLVREGHTKQAAQECGSLLEMMLRELYRQTVGNLSGGDQRAFTETLERVGKGKPVDELTLGQLVGLYREAKLFEKAEQVLGRKLSHLGTTNFNTFVDIRNRATHKGEQVSQDEANLFAAQMSVFLTEIGLLQDDHKAPQAVVRGQIKPWVEVVTLHPDVLSEDFSEDIFALDLGPLADRNANVPAVYRDPEHFFRASYLTSGLRSLLEDVLSRLGGGAGGRVLKLITPFGGGKSHTLAALFHAANARDALDVIPEGKSLPRPGKANVAVFDGQFVDATHGKKIPGTEMHAQTMWGWIAWSLGREKGYELLREQDQTRVAPGGDEILELLKDGPNLILLDEVLNYLISAGGVKVEKTTLRDETLTFLQRLTVAVGNTKNTALVFSLQSSKRESLEYINLLQTVDHLAARKDQRREPVEGNEVLSVIQRRLLAKLPDAEDASPAATAYQEVFTQMRRAYAQSSAEAQQAEEDGLALRDRIRAAYPFHPELIGLMRERWAAIPDFQRTRGALRFLAACLRACHREGRSRTVLGPADVPMYDAEVRQAFFKEVGQQADFQAVLEHDLVGANARARRIDNRRAKETPAEAGKYHATRLATAILMYSFGGLRREEGKETLPPGIVEQELLSVCVGPDLDSTTALACLKELKEQCLYLHFDGVRYCFKKDPNVTLLVEQEADSVGRDEGRVRRKIKDMIEERLGGYHETIVWPEKSVEIPHDDPRFLIAYMPLEFGGMPRKAQEEKARELFEKYGDRPRKYRNGLGLAIPSDEQIEVLRRSVRYLLAVEQVKHKAKQLNLTDEQKGQLRERESTEESAAESALMRLYMEVWLPRVENGGISIEAVVPGGRPLQTTLNGEKKAAIHERIMELIAAMYKKVFATTKPTKIVELFKLGEGEPPRLGLRLAEVVEGFYSFLGFPRLMSQDAVRKAVACGVQESLLGYFSGPTPELGEDRKFKVALDRVRIGKGVADDEIDLDTGFIMLPSAVPQAERGAVQPPGGGEPGGQQPPVVPPLTGGGGLPPVTPPTTETQKVVQISFSADRNALYTAWNAVANLADLAGKINVILRAESQDGFDKSKLQNGVIEPLREADLIE